ncbi:MAG: heterodisulfide reductase subunit [Thermoproteota archaeon]|nr:heterodisulfide reductase subunit [Thermoproteota archaeon]
MVQFGLKDRLLSDDHLWLCSTCYACVDHCPQNVEPASIVRALRNMVVKERNKMPLVSRELATSLLKSGYIYAMPESRLKRRVEQGLPPLPKTNVKEIERIFKVTGFTSLLENAKTFEKVAK